MVLWATILILQGAGFVGKCPADKEFQPESPREFQERKTTVSRPPTCSSRLTPTNEASAFAVCRLGDRHSRRAGEHNGDVSESDVGARVVEHQPGRAGREIRRDVQANRCQVRFRWFQYRTNRARIIGEWNLVDLRPKKHHSIVAKKRKRAMTLRSSFPQACHFWNLSRGDARD